MLPKDDVEFDLFSIGGVVLPLPELTVEEDFVVGAEPSAGRGESAIACLGRVRERERRHVSKYSGENERWDRMGSSVTYWSRCSRTRRLISLS